MPVILDSKVREDAGNPRPLISFARKQMAHLHAPLQMMCKLSDAFWSSSEPTLVTAPVTRLIRVIEDSTLRAFVINPAARVTCEGSIGDRATRQFARQ